MRENVQQAALFITYSSYKSFWQFHVPLGLINCPFALCTAVGRTVRWLRPGLLSHEATLAWEWSSHDLC